MLNKIKDFIIKKKYLFITLVLLLLVVVILIVVIMNNTSKEVSASYDEIKELIDNNETFIIYYYNSKSSNEYNKKIKNYLDDEGINYFLYDDSKVDKEEYSLVLNLMGIDESLFGGPAIIYVRDGVMFSNLININDTDTVGIYIKDYDLVTVK